MTNCTCGQKQPWAARSRILESALSDTLATLHAIAAGELLRSLPEDTAAAADHNAASVLLGMLRDQLYRAEREVDEIDEQTRVARP